MEEKILKQIAQWMYDGCRGIELAKKYTRYIDLFLEGIFYSVDEQPGLLLLATGGYGREELAPFSDIDIMFFVTDRTNTGNAERILYKLWDSGLEISHSVRTADECLEEALRDIRTRTSLLEARYIAGDKSLYQRFRNDVYPVIAYKKKKDFVRDKLKEFEKRHQESGDSVFLLEPHIKEGEGSLRDIHTICWLLRVVYKSEKITDLSVLVGQYAYKRFMSAYNFMLQLRYCLHLESKRRNDILSFEYQKNVSRCLGFKDSKKFSGPERMMRYYYLKSKVIKDISGQIVLSCSKQYMPVFKNLSIKKITEEFSLSAGKLITTQKNLLGTNTDKIMESFYLSAQSGMKFSSPLKEQIKSNLLRINKRTINSSVSIHYFTGIFQSKYVYNTLREMHETGVLGRFIPEFGALRWLVLYEPYHLYTVDEHTLMAIKNLENLRTTRYKHLDELRVISNSVKELDLIYMALLFHDIGKAAGKYHEEEGYRRLKNIMDRFNFVGTKRATVEFLVKNHILMSRLAMTREPGDMDVIARFAATVGNMENLKALYLITYADMSAVNPQFWSSWKAYLLHELYLSASEYLSGIKKGRAEYIRSLQSQSPELGREELFQFLEEMPERYLLSTNKARVISDFELKKKALEAFFSMRIDNMSNGITEIVICTRDFPGLFSKIVGFLSSKSMNIFSGDLFTGKDGIVIDKISISNWNEIAWEGFERELEEGLKGIIVDEKPVKLVQRKCVTKDLFGLFIEFDNETSPVFSIIEIFTQDRLGLLYDISMVLYKKGINIVSARLLTESGLAQDIFYVQAENKKITDSMTQEMLLELWTLLKK